MSESADTLRFLKARPMHVRFISTLAREEIERGLVWTWRPLRVARTLACKDHLGVVATIDDLEAGFCLAGYGMEKLHIALLCVDPDARGMGLGRRLVEWHERCACVAGIERIELELRASNDEARGFYERLGFDVVARRQRYYQGVEDALSMRKVLRTS